MSLLARAAYEHALTERKTVRLEHHGHFALIDILVRFFRAVEHLVFGGGDTVLFHEVFGKRLARLYYRRFRSGTERAVSVCVQAVDKPHCEGIVGSDNRHIYVLMRVYELDDLVDVGSLYVGVTFRNLRNSCIARQSVELADLIGLLEFPSDCVFSSAAADYKYVFLFGHRFSPLLFYRKK